MNPSEKRVLPEYALRCSKDIGLMGELARHVVSEERTIVFETSRVVDIDGTI